MPATRSPAQTEASRRNGARSKGPVTPEGKARASRNALTHGLCAMHHLVVEGEIPLHLDELITRMIEETGAVGEIETRLARRLAIAFWKGERAERMEVAILDAAPTTRMNGYRQEAADPLTTFDVRRFNAIRAQQAQIGREIKNCLAELRRLRDEPLGCTDAPEGGPTEEQLGTGEPGPAFENEPESRARNEPESPAPANDDAAPPADAAPRNEPGEPVGEEAADALWLVGGVPLLDISGRPCPQPLAAAGWRVLPEALEAAQGPARGGAAHAAVAPG